MDEALAVYLDDLTRELRARGVYQSHIVEEIESHLREAIEQGQCQGLNAEAAQRQAIQRFGSAQTVAAQFAAERNNMLYKVLLGVALSLGALITYVDSRPTWDDTGITAFAILLSCGLLGILGPKRPWLWALGVGLWIPILGITVTHNYGTLLALPFAFAGAYAGMAFRKIVAPA